MLGHVTEHADGGFIVHTRRAEEGDRSRFPAGHVDFGRDDGEVVIVTGDMELDGSFFAPAFHRLTEGLGVVDEFEQFAKLLGILGEFRLFELKLR